MGIGTGIFIAVLGAVLFYAVTAEVSGVDIETVGAILMAAGLIIAFISAVATVSARRRRVWDDGYFESEKI